VQSSGIGKCPLSSGQVQEPGSVVGGCGAGVVVDGGGLGVVVGGATVVISSQHG